VALGFILLKSFEIFIQENPKSIIGDITIKRIIVQKYGHKDLGGVSLTISE
jgi:hypothetical protein